MRVLEVNVVGPFLTTQAFYPLLLKRKTRTVVNVSSELASISWTRSASHPLTGKIISYCSSKAALNMRAPPALRLSVPFASFFYSCVLKVAGYWAHERLSKALSYEENHSRCLPKNSWQDRCTYAVLVSPVSLYLSAHAPMFLQALLR